MFALIRLFAGVTGTALALHLAVRIERGSGEGAGWIPDAEGSFEGTLAGLPSDWSGGLAENRA